MNPLEVLQQAIKGFKRGEEEYKRYKHSQLPYKFKIGGGIVQDHKYIPPPTVRGYLVKILQSPSSVEWKDHTPVLDVCSWVSSGGYKHNIKAFHIHNPSSDHDFEWTKLIQPSPRETILPPVEYESVARIKLTTLYTGESDLDYTSIHSSVQHEGSLIEEDVHLNDVCRILSSGIYKLINSNLDESVEFVRKR